MKDTDKKKDFIELRAKDWSFQRISEEISVSKPTLIKWDKEFKYEIETLKGIVFEGLYQEYEATARQRVEYLGELHQKMVKELRNRELSNVRTDKLLDMVIKTSDKIENIKARNQYYFRTKEDIKEQKDQDEIYNLPVGF